MKWKNPLKLTPSIVTGIVALTVLFCFFIPKGIFYGRAGMTNVLYATSFSDVLSANVNYDAISYVHSQGIVDGYPDGTYRSENLINRAEFTKIIIGAYSPGQAAGSNCFPDVGEEWFAKYVCFSKIHNFINGYPDGSFRPANNINFAEVAKILVNVAGLPVTQDSEVWYKPYVTKLSDLQAIPLSIKSFDQKVTRGEMAEMIYRLRAKVAGASSRTFQELQQEQLSVGLPVNLQISGINVDAPIENVGLTSDGAVGIPSNPNNAAWYNLGPRPGDVGSAVITGHVNWYYGATGVFADLHKLQPGDRISVLDDKGATVTFVVRESRSYDAAAQADDVFFSTDGKAHLNLITCEGVWDSKAKQYTQRLVVFADKI